jgi:hypothetical protein
MSEVPAPNEDSAPSDANEEEAKVVVTPLLWVLGVLCLLVGLGGGVVFSMMSLSK